MLWPALVRISIRLVYNTSHPNIDHSVLGSVISQCFHGMQRRQVYILMFVDGDYGNNKVS